jgi:hypothetical protein
MGRALFVGLLIVTAANGAVSLSLIFVYILWSLGKRLWRCRWPCLTMILVGLLSRGIIVFFCDYPATPIGPETPAAARPPIRLQLIEQYIPIAKVAIEIHLNGATCNLLQSVLGEIQTLTHAGDVRFAGGHCSDTDSWRLEEVNRHLLCFWQRRRAFHHEHGISTGDGCCRDAAAVLNSYAKLPWLVRYESARSAELGEHEPRAASELQIVIGYLVTCSDLCECNPHGRELLPVHKTDGSREQRDDYVGRIAPFAQERPVDDILDFVRDHDLSTVRATCSGLYVGVLTGDKDLISKRLI